MSNRPVSSALRSLGRLNGRSTRASAICARQFGTTQPRGVRVTFSETENAELNHILSTIQEKIILPSYLPPKQRKIVFDPKMKSYLQQNPVVIEIEGLEHKFSSIDRFKGVENSKKILMDALAKMKTREDWNNLGPLLAGYKKAGIKLQPSHWGKIVRVAGSTGHIYTILECAKQSDETGLKISRHETTARALANINDKIVASDGSVTAAVQALKWSEIVLDLLQRPQHIESKEGKVHFSRVVRGLTLYTRAAAIKAMQAAEQDVEHQLTLLRDEVELLKTLWSDVDTSDLKQVEDFARLHPVVERQSEVRGVPKALNGSAYVQALAQNIKGLSVTRELLGTEAQELQKVEAAIAKHLEQFVQENKQRKEGWATEYERVIGSAPSWPPMA